MAYIHPLKKTPDTHTLKDLQKIFIRNIEKSLEGYDEGRVVFYKYLDTSLKDNTRAKRSSTADAKEYKLYTEMKLTMSMKDLLSSNKNKRQLTIIFAEGLINSFKEKRIKLYVIYEDKIVGPGGSPEKYRHEEADTLISQQVIASADEDPSKEIMSHVTYLLYL